MPRLKRISKKQKDWADNFLQHGNGKKAALQSYPGIKETTAHAIAHKNKEHQLVKNYMAKVLERKGITDEYLAEKLKDIIDAGTLKRVLKEAKVKDAMSAIQASVALKDLMPAHKIKTEATRLNVDIEGKSEEELAGILDNLVGEIKTFKAMMKANTVEGEVIDGTDNT